jgi:hypothetical protein
MPLVRFFRQTALSFLSRNRAAGQESSNSSEDETLLYAIAILEEARKEVDRADSKASILLAASGVGIGALLAGLLAGTWTPVKLPVIAQLLWWAGAFSAAIGIGCLSWAVYPRRHRRDSEALETIAYYSDVIAFRSVPELVAGLTKSAGMRIELVADQIRQISRIVNYKYQLIRWGMLVLYLATVAVLASLLIDIALR